MGEAGEIKSGRSENTTAGTAGCRRVELQYAMEYELGHLQRGGAARSLPFLPGIPSAVDDVAAGADAVDDVLPVPLTTTPKGAHPSPARQGKVPSASGIPLPSRRRASTLSTLHATPSHDHAAAAQYSESYFEAFAAQYGRELTGLRRLEADTLRCAFCRTPGSGGICTEHMAQLRSIKQATTRQPGQWRGRSRSISAQRVGGHGVAWKGGGDPGMTRGDPRELSGQC